jgi:hypothetical protein
MESYRKKEVRGVMPVSGKDDVPGEVRPSFRSYMFGGDFVFSVGHDFFRNRATTRLVLMGNDVFHPSAAFHEVAELAPHVEFVPDWREEKPISGTIEKVPNSPRTKTPEGNPHAASSSRDPART